MSALVYVETSVISYYAARPSRDIIVAGRQQITRDWWENTRTQFKTYISVLVLKEAKDGDAGASKKRLDILEGFPVLDVNEEAEKLAASLVKSGPIPEQSPEDALHISIATVNGMDYLLTWNFNHINNAQMKSGIAKIAENHGYDCPVICTPEELIGE